MRKLLVWTVVVVSAVSAVALLGRILARKAPAGDSLVADPVPARPEPQPPTQASFAPTDPHPLPDVLVDPKVVIGKSQRRLTVFSAGEPVKGYRVVLGREPVGDKEREGDGKTPEGEFYVCTKNPSSKYDRALGLSYPSEEDADRGLASGLITKRDHRTIVTAIHRMQQPLWKTALGGEIMIHGDGSGRGDWTLGCIALDDTDIEELFTALPMGTPVEIRP